MFPLSRRELFIGLATLGALGWPSESRATTARTLDRLASTFATAASLLSSLNFGLLWAVNHRAWGWDIASARRARDRLRMLSGQLVELLTPNAATIHAISDFYDHWAPPDTEGLRAFPSYGRHQRLHARDVEWDWVKGQCGRMLRLVMAMLNTLDRERSAFAHSEPYRALQETLEGRASLLAELRVMERPQSDAEFAALAAAVRRYRLLHARLRETSTLVDRYVLTFDG